MTLDDLKNTNIADLSRHLQEMAPAVLEARDKYNALLNEQRLYTAARELQTDGVWVGDRVRVDGAGNKIYRVGLTPAGHIQLQRLVNGKEVGQPVALWEVGAIERIEQPA